MRRVLWWYYDDAKKKSWNGEHTMNWRRVTICINSLSKCESKSVFSSAIDWSSFINIWVQSQESRPGLIQSQQVSAPSDWSNQGGHLDTANPAHIEESRGLTWERYNDMNLNWINELNEAEWLQAYIIHCSEKLLQLHSSGKMYTFGFHGIMAWSS